MNIAAKKAGLAVIAVAAAGFVALTPGAFAQSPAKAAASAAVAPIFAPPPGAPLSFADIFDRVSPAVVSINVTSMVDRQAFLGIPGFGVTPPSGRGGGGDDQDEQGGGDQGDQGAPGAPGGGGNGGKQQAMASGSGFFISSDGYIVTNNHVVENAKDIKVVLKDERELPARVIGRDEGTDLAVIKVEGKDFPYVDFENSSRPRVGDWVIAVGNPFGLGGTATAGIISAYGRDIGEKFVDYIQIDAPINRGNSGGPTFDIYGRVIGINTAIFSPSGGSVGIGFAIPADIADNITKQLIAGGKITRGYLGASIQDVTPEIAESLGKPGLKGAMVDELVSEGPAQKAGVASGDIVLSINGADVHGATDLTRRVAGSHTGDILHLQVLRDGKTIAIDVHSGLRPSEAELAKVQNGAGGDGGGDQGGPVKPGALGLTVAPVDAAARRAFNLSTEIKGVVILDLSPTSDAASKGLKRGDVVVRINDKPVLTAGDLAAEVQAARKAGRTNVLLFINRDQHQMGVPIKLDSDDAAKGKSKDK